MSRDVHEVIGSLEKLRECLAQEDYTGAAACVRHAQEALFSGEFDDDAKADIQGTLRVVMHDAQTRQKELAAQLDANQNTRTAMNRYGRGFSSGRAAYGRR